MNEQSQRIAIATFCGWQAIELRDSIKSGKKDWLSGLNPKPDEIVKVIDAESGEERAPNESDYGYETLPDYLHDLNAMHEAEKMLNGEQWNNYGRLVDYFSRSRTSRLPWKEMNPSRVIDAYLIHAEAEHRAGAFVRAIGEWRD
jgi:hypothetical protein